LVAVNIDHRTPRTLRIVTYLPKLDSIGGVERHQLETIRELAARGHRICLFYEQSGNLADEFSAVCDSMHGGPSPLYSDSPLRDLPRIGMRALAARGCHPDLIYTSNFSELAWAAGIKGLTRAPIVCHPHEFRPVRTVSLRTLGSLVSRFVVSSEFMRDAWLSHGLDASRVEVIYNALPATAAYAPGSEQERLDARRSLGLPEDGFVVLYMGRLIPEKGVDVLLEAWQHLGLPPDDARLLVVGLPATHDDYVERLRTNAPQGCQWLPLRRDVGEVLHAADVLVLPSIWDEPFGRVIVEAMASGRPAVASAVGGIPEILDGEFTRMLFPRGDSEALAERLRGLRDWRHTDPTLGERCVEHVEHRFRLETAVTQLEDVFAAALGVRA
jgi:glycosyltransferase involved in cell wall biosynthesis